MREFKFIRGKYTNENIFNSDETENCLFAYDSKGDLVQFTEKNDKDFQEKFADLSSDSRLSEIYTLRPSQFKISAQKESAGHYSFNFKADEKVYDGSRQFPTKVIENAETYIKAHTEAEFNTTSKLPLLNLAGDAVRQTPTTFKFNNDKTFTRNLVFKVSGFLKERGYVTASGENIEAYPTVENKINYSDTPTRGTFYGGLLQEEAPLVEKSIVSNTSYIGYDESKTVLDAASKYHTKDDNTAFIYNGQFAKEVNYAEGLSFQSYEKVSEYLTPSDADHAVTISRTFANAGSQKYTLNNDTFTPFNGTPVENAIYYEVNSGGSIYASKVNNAPASKLITENITFVCGVFDLVDLLFDKAVTQEGTNTMITAYKIQENNLNYVIYEGNTNNWVEIKSGNIIVEYKYNNTTKISSILYSNGAYSAVLEGTDTPVNVNKSNVVAKISLLGTNVSSILKFKFFDTSSMTKYIITSDYENYLNGEATPSDFIRLTQSVVNVSYILKSNFVAYERGKQLDTIINDNQKNVLRVSSGDINKIDSTNYDFYYKVTEDAYIARNAYTVAAPGTNTIIKGYGASYSGLFIRSGTSLRDLIDTDLIGYSISVYTRQDYHCIGNGVYDNSTDETRYVMLSGDEWAYDVSITKDNASVNGDIVSPKTTESVLRLIVDGTLAVTATQSD